MEQTGPLILVTGATDGIGRETALTLARRGARVIAHGRSPEKVAALRRELAAVAGGEPPAPLVADFASLAAVRAMAAELASREPIDVLLNNAGLFARTRQRSVDGFELTFAVNHLAPFVLTHAIVQGPAGARLRRVVFVASEAHRRGQIRLDDPQLLRGGYEDYFTYATSKLANVLTAVELARRLRPRGVAVNALHPGVVSTKLLTAGVGVEGPETLAQGAATSVLLALGPVGEQVAGRYFEHEREATTSAAGQDAALARELYELSARMAEVAPLPEPG